MASKESSFDLATAVKIALDKPDVFESMADAGLIDSEIVKQIRAELATVELSKSRKRLVESLGNATEAQAEEFAAELIATAELLSVYQEAEKKNQQGRGDKMIWSRGVTLETEFGTLKVTLRRPVTIEEASGQTK